MLTLAGPVAYSPFRVNALINNINTSVNSSAVIGIRTIYVHYVSLKEHKSLDDDKTAMLTALLDYDSKPDVSDSLTSALVDAVSSHNPSLPDNSYLLRVIPRKGTISPWSSKATNILQNCGLQDEVDRVERGLALIIQVRKGFPLDEHLGSGVFLGFIYDRMTQV
jgi:phosphoribosylformylglycinamidine synthase